MGCCHEKDTQPSLITNNTRRFERNKVETNINNINTTNITNFNTTESKVVIIEVNNIKIISPMTPKVKKSHSSLRVHHLKEEKGQRKNIELSKYSYLFSDQPNKHVKTTENCNSLIDNSALNTKDYRRASVFLLDHKIHDDDLSNKYKKLKRRVGKKEESPI